MISASMGIVFVLFLIWFFWPGESKAEFEYTITNLGISKIQVTKSKFLNQFQRYHAAYTKEWAHGASFVTKGDQFYMSFEGFSDYKIGGNIITLITKSELEFKIAANNNLKEITEILDKYIKKG